MLIHGIQFVNVRYARRKVNDMAHTPGPWTIVHYGWLDKGKGGDFVGRIEGPNGEKVYGGAGSFHAVNNLANARLIAAAPDLLAMLTEARKAIASLDFDALGTGETGYAYRDELLANIDNAIAPAKGE